LQFNGNKKMLTLLGDSKIANWVKPEARNSIILFNLNLRGVMKIRDLNDSDLNRLGPLLRDKELKSTLFRIIPIARRLRPDIEPADLNLYPMGENLKTLSSCSARDIRVNRMSKETICDFKIGLNLNLATSLTWLNHIRKLTSVKHRNTMLRVAHGEIYSRERLFRFGLADSERCERCGEIETTRYKLFECETISNLWSELKRVTDSVLTNVDPAMDSLHRNMGAFLSTDLTLITSSAELMTILMGNLQGTPDPRGFIKSLMINLSRKEGNAKIKTALTELCNEHYNQD